MTPKTGIASEEIVVCPNCIGEGIIEESRILGPQNEYKEWTRLCKTCEGKGRLIKHLVVEYTVIQD